MKSRVYFVRTAEADAAAAIQDKLRRLIKAGGVFDVLEPEQRAVIKIHFGEEGNNGYVRPELVRQITAEIRRRGAYCCVSDSNTLYRGRRTRSDEHVRLANEHGFSEETLLAPVVIPEDARPGNDVTVPVAGKFIQKANVLRLYTEADILVGVSHFKGHGLTGFGGTLKNIGMGCASREGKLAQHSEVAPFVFVEQCVGCGTCIPVCPVDAISMCEKTARIDSKKCIGCATCIAVCPHFAIQVDWSAGGKTIQQKMMEYVLAVLQDKKGRGIFFNFAVKITKECDCLAKDDPRVAPDVGIFVSDDPVSVDAAAYEQVTAACGKDIFRQLHPWCDGAKQLEYAEALGLGSREYELVEVR
ncbi:MAG: DUF362 domain-containing protein [Candidatus Omnitrophica bacterium]|nr:DUF362 domain-containing protein [Candidatus Omnitrophota bacterium]